jgi:hypothetical protein
MALWLRGVALTGSVSGAAGISTTLNVRFLVVEPWILRRLFIKKPLLVLKAVL